MISNCRRLPTDGTASLLIETSEGSKDHFAPGAGGRTALGYERRWKGGREGRDQESFSDIGGEWTIDTGPFGEKEGMRRQNGKLVGRTES